jgi:hypothetical protein
MVLMAIDACGMILKVGSLCYWVLNFGAFVVVGPSSRCLCLKECFIRLFSL